MYNTDDIDRFWTRVAVAGEADCWNWTAGKNGVRYGVFYCDTGGGRRAILAHRFSLGLALKKDLPRELFVLHSCDNPSCVNPKHLRLGTQRDNVRDAIIRKRHVNPPLPKGNPNPPKGEAVWNAKATEAQIREVWRLHFTGMNATQIAKTVGVSKTTVADACRGKIWRSIEGAPSKEELALGGVPHKKLTPEDIEAIKALLATGMTVKSIAAIYGISTAPISNLKNHGKTWVPKPG